MEFKEIWKIPEGQPTPSLTRKWNARNTDEENIVNSRLLPVPKQQLTEGWNSLELLDTLPEEDKVFDLLQIAPTISGLTTMANEEARRESFKLYPNDLLLNIGQLVSAGFFWTGAHNKMKCCGCGVEHSDWERSVSPFSRHLQISPNCVFLKRSYTPEYLKSTSELVKREPAYSSPGPTARKEKVTKKDVALFIDSRPYASIRDNPEKFGLEKGSRKKMTAELYKAVEHRRKFNMTVPGKEPEIIEMVREMREKNIVKNGPQKRHVISDVSCHFEEELRREMTEMEQKSRSQLTPGRTQERAFAVLENVDANQIAQSMRCKICLDQLCGLLLLPCAHIATCASCGMSQALCPICRAKIQGTTSIKFFGG